MSLRRRASELQEVMDDPDCDRAVLVRTLRRFGLVNRTVAGWSSVYRARLRPQLLRAAGTARLLDIGCGGGDVLRHLVRLARRDHIAVEGVGIDPDPRAIAVAAESTVQGIRWRRSHSSALVQEGERFDAVVSNHVLHHLAPNELQTVLSDSEALSHGICVHSDIRRSRLAYALFSVASLPVAPGTLLRADGLTSIRRSYTQRELAALMPRGWRIEQPSMFRLLAVHRQREDRWTQT